MSGAIGIDLGSQCCLIGAVNKGGIDVLTNDLSNRATPSVVGFTQKFRSPGEIGYSKISTNFRNTVLFPTRFLGLKPNSPFIEEERKWITHPINLESEEILHEVNFAGESHKFSTERVVAMLLTHLEEIVSEKNKIKITDVVVSVPNYFNELERMALLNAISISGIPVTKIMNEGTAIALSYGLFRNNEFTDAPRIVAFADLGHSKFSVSIAQFCKDKLEVLTHWSDRNLGGRDFDYLLMKYFSAGFLKKYNIDLMTNQRARMKMAVAIEKVRKNLTGNSDAALNIEYIVEEYDLAGIITRETFEELCGDLLDRIERNCKIALQRAGIQGVHSVEILGGASRMPMVQRVYAKAFQVEQVSKTLHIEEAVARGCAVQSAMLSPLYKVKDFSIKDMVYYPLKFYYTPKDMDIDTIPEVLFDEKNTFPVTKIINTCKKAPFRVKIFNEACGIGSNFLVDCPEEMEDYKIKIHIKMDKNGVLSLEKAERIEKVVEEEKMNVDKAPEGEKTEEAVKAEGEVDAKKEEEKKQEEAKKAKSKIKRIPLPCSGEQRGMNEKALKDAIDAEKAFANKDRLAKETLDKKNELESYIYESRSQLNEVLEPFTQSQSLQKLILDLKSVEDWLYDEGSDTLKANYEKNLKQLKDQITPIQARCVFWSEIEPALSSLESSIKYSYEMLSNTDEKYSHVLTTDRQAFVNKALEHQEFLDNIRKTLTTKNKYEDAGISVDDINKKAAQQREVTNQIMNRPKPAPKPEPKPEAKTEEKTEEKKAEDVKTEENKAKEEGAKEGEDRQEKPMELD